MTKTCKNCCHHSGDAGPAFGENTYFCSLTGIVAVDERITENCSWYNRELEGENICYNCKYFLGGADYGLACSKVYHRLPTAISEPCEDFDRKSDFREEKR